MDTIELNNGNKVETGCFVDSHWGQYGQARMIIIAKELGANISDEDVELAQKHLDSMLPNPSAEFDDDDFDHLMYAGDNALLKINEITPEGYYWDWYDGEFFLWPDEEWEE